MENLLGWGVVHNANVYRLLGVVTRGHRIAEEALQLEVTDNLNRILKELMDKKETKTWGGGGEGGGGIWKTNIHLNHSYKCQKNYLK